MPRDHRGRAFDELLRIARPARFVDIFNRTVEPVAGKCRLSTRACFGNYKARAVGKANLQADVSGVSGDQG